MKRWYFWVLAPVMLATGLGLPFITEPPSLQGRMVLYLFCGALVLATLGLARPRRFQWALRAVAGAILLAYLVYATHEALAWWQGKPFGLGARRSASNLRNALWGLAVFGLPSLYFLLRGRSGTSVDALLDVPNGSHTRPASAPGAMNARNIVALRGDFDARFPDLREALPDQDRVPGRDLAECVLAGLRRGQIETTGPFYDEPFFELRCQVAGRRIEVICYIYEPAAETWVVEVVRKTGFLARLRGDADDAEVSTVAGAIHEALLHDGRVREARWFSKLPASPFGNVSFSVSPS